MGSSAEASKSWLLSIIAAFGPGKIYGVNDRGIKILIIEHNCCLWSWLVSSGQWQRHQNLDYWACLLPLILAGFMGSSAEASKSWLLSMFAAFDLGEIYRVNGRGIKNLIFEHVCCLWSGQVSWGQGRRHQKLDFCAWLLPLVLARYMGSTTEAAKARIFAGSVAFAWKQKMRGNFRQNKNKYSRIRQEARRLLW